jgi:hypothetical protein
LSGLNCCSADRIDKKCQFDVICCLSLYHFRSLSPCIESIGDFRPMKVGHLLSDRCAPSPSSCHNCWHCFLTIYALPFRPEHLFNRQRKTTSRPLWFDRLHVTSFVLRPHYAPGPPNLAPPSPTLLHATVCGNTYIDRAVRNAVSWSGCKFRSNCLFVASSCSSTWPLARLLISLASIHR